MDAREAEAISQWIEEANSGIRGLDGRAWLQQTALKWPSVDSVLSWWIENGLAARAARAAIHLVPYWMTSGRFAEGSERLASIAAALDLTDGLRGELVFHRGMLLFWQGEDEQARRLFTASLDLARTAVEPNVAALAKTGLARLALREPEGLPRAYALSASALEEDTLDETCLGWSSAVHVLGVACQMSGDLAGARSWTGKRVAALRIARDARGLAFESGNLAIVERQLGNLDRAEELARLALDIYARRNDAWALPFGLAGMAAIACARGDHGRAAWLSGAADRAHDAVEQAWPPDELIHHEETKRSAERALGPAQARLQLEQGQQASLAEALNVALGPDRDSILENGLGAQWFAAVSKPA
jgi:tetratricopeptide (TPR) repeat protein